MSKQVSPTYLSLVSYIYENKVLYIAWGIFLIFLTSQISIPLEPVPITLQTFGVMLVGLTFNRAEAIKSVAGYLVLGAVGMPVFANFSSGYHCLLGPTGGYLIGFLASVAIMASIRPFFNNKNLFFIMINCLIGTVVILSFGITRLSHFVGFKEAIQAGLMPFIFPGIVKAILLALTIRYLRLGRI